MSLKVLVVDDDQSIREALERGLQLEGFLVSSASSGDMAIQEVEENLFLGPARIPTGTPESAGSGRIRERP